MCCVALAQLLAAGRLLAAPFYAGYHQYHIRHDQYHFLIGYFAVASHYKWQLKHFFQQCFNCRLPNAVLPECIGKFGVNGVPPRSRNMILYFPATVPIFNF